MPMLTASDQSVLVRVGRGGCPAVDVDLGEDVAEMPRHGLLTEEQFCCDASVRVALGYQDQHLTLPSRQRVTGRCASDWRQRSTIKLGAKLFEDGTRRIQLHPRRILVTQRPARRAHLNPGTGGLIRRIDLLP